MVTNREVMPFKGSAVPDGFKGGNAVYDTSAPEGFKGGLGDLRRARRPASRGTSPTGPPAAPGMAGVHRFDFDGRYAYISPTVDGYLGNIVMILDLKNPAKPEEVGRWWMPGQWTAGGETPTWGGSAHRCHHPLRAGNRLYTSYWHGGFVILDIDDMSKPKLMSHVDWSPPFSMADAHDAEGAVPGRRPAALGRRRRGRAEARAVAAGIHVVRQYRRRNQAGADLDFSARMHRRFAAAELHRLSPAVREDHGHRNSGGVVRARTARRRFFQAARTEGGRHYLPDVPAGSQRRGRSDPNSRAPEERGGVLSLIGNTPLVRSAASTPGRASCSSSSRARTRAARSRTASALSMIEAAERERRAPRPARPSSRRRPATPASAWRSSRRARATELTLVIPDKMSQEKIFHLRALGAEV